MNTVARVLLATLLSAAIGACDPEATNQRSVGQLESERIELVAEYAEPIIERLAVEGQSVAAGELLIRQNDERATVRIAQLESTLEQQRARLAELTRGPREEQILAEQATVAGARQELDYRETEYRRAKDVHQRKLASPESLDRAKASLDAARATLEFHEARLAELLAGTTIEELRQAESAVRHAEAQLAAGRIDRARHDLVAPVDGVVDSVLYELGERPALGTPIVVLLSSAQPYARVYVPASLRANVTPGSAARILVDGIDEALTGRVRWVASEAAFTPYFALTEYDRGRLSYVAKIDIDDRIGARIEANDRRLPDGLPVEVEFVLD